MTGLLLPGERKSVEPMAARVDARQLGALHQSMHHFVANSAWSDRDVLRVARDWALPALERHGVLAAWAVGQHFHDKRGKASVGVARQSVGPGLGRRNGQRVVTLSAVNASMSVPAAYDLVMPRSARDRERWEIVLPRVAEQLGDGLPRAPVIAGPGLGSGLELCRGLADLGVDYVVETDRRPRLPRADCERSELSWRDSGHRTITSWFSIVDGGGGERLLVQWASPDGAAQRLWRTRLSREYRLSDLVQLATLGWRVERDFGDMRQMLGVHHYEGRNWRGFHHHGTLCCAAFAFLAAERAQLTPPMPLTFLQPLLLPPGFTPRGAGRSRR